MSVSRTASAENCYRDQSLSRPVERVHAAYVANLSGKIDEFPLGVPLYISVYLYFCSLCARFQIFVALVGVCLILRDTYFPPAAAAGVFFGSVHAPIVRPTLANTS